MLAIYSAMAYSHIVYVSNNMGGASETHCIQSVIIWGGASETQINKIRVAMNKILRVIFLVKLDEIFVSLLNSNEKYSELK